MLQLLREYGRVRIAVQGEGAGPRHALPGLRGEASRLDPQGIPLVGIREDTWLDRRAICDMQPAQPKHHAICVCNCA